MKKFIYTLSFVLAAFAMGACVNNSDYTPEEKPVVEVEKPAEATLRLRVSVPQYGPSSRAAMTSANESKISDLYVMVFTCTTTPYNVATGTFSQLVKAQNVATASGTTTASITIPLSGLAPAGGSTRFLALANCGAALDDATNGLGVNTTEALTNLGSNNKFYSAASVIWGAYTAPYVKDSIAMSGYVDTSIAQDNLTAASSIGSIELQRVVARVDVGVGSPSETTLGDYSTTTWDGYQLNAAGTAPGTTPVRFKLDEVVIYKASDRASLYAFKKDSLTVPTGTGTGSTALAAHSYINPGSGDPLFTAGTTPNAALAADATNRWITREIYIPEANVLMGGAAAPGTGYAFQDANHENRMAIVVGGYYDANEDGVFAATGDEADKVYYRIDFRNSSGMMNVVRNHIYRFNIVDVTYKGDATADDAYKSRGLPITVTVDDWDVIDIPGNM